MDDMESFRERTLIERFRGGDSDAFADLVRPWHRRLVGYLARMSGDPVSADDLVQQTLIRVWRGLPSYDDRKRFGSWLFTIAHHVTVDHLRRRRREGLHLPDIPETASSADPSSELMARELGRLLAHAIDGLPEKQRRVFSLRQHGRLKFREIAELTDEPLSTVLGHMSYATAKLERIVREYHDQSHR
jgi:RNA polymerase sigma-70 factor (ECF subfamily)